MTVGELIKELEKCDRDKIVEIWGAYASTGDVLRVDIGVNDDNHKWDVIAIHSDISSG